MYGNMEKTMVITYVFAKVFFFSLFHLKFKILSLQVSGEKHIGFILDRNGKSARFNDLLK